MDVSEIPQTKPEFFHGHEMKQVAAQWEGKVETEEFWRQPGVQEHD
jgi:hypothetical protein